MSMLDQLSNWLAERQEKQLVRKAGGTELTGDGVSLSAFMKAFDMPEDTRARMEAMAENYGLPRRLQYEWRTFIRRNSECSSLIW